jgi:hypothetical protein
MRWIVSVFVLLFAATDSAAAQADRWRAIYSDPGEVVVSIDTTRLVPAKVTVTSGTVRVLGVWTKWQYVRPQKPDSGKAFVTTMFHKQVSCDPLAFDSDYWTRYDVKSDVLDSEDTRDRPWLLSLKEPVPDTRGEAVFRAVCRLYGSLIDEH